MLGKNAQKGKGFVSKARINKNKKETGNFPVSRSLKQTKS